MYGEKEGVISFSGPNPKVFFDIKVCTSIYLHLGGVITHVRYSCC
jgi:hypothetical protein